MSSPGLFHYGDATCGFACLCAEGLYWALTTLLGAQALRCDAIADEWEPCTAEALRAAPSAALVVALAGVAPNETSLNGFGIPVPRRLPDGLVYAGDAAAAGLEPREPAPVEPCVTAGACCCDVNGTSHCDVASAAAARATPRWSALVAVVVACVGWQRGPVHGTRR